MKRFFILVAAVITLNGCDVLQNLPTTVGGGLSEGEAGQGIKEALGQGLTNAVLKLNKEGFLWVIKAKVARMPPREL